MIAWMLFGMQAIADEAPEMSGAKLYRVFCASCDTLPTTKMKRDARSRALE